MSEPLARHTGGQKRVGVIGNGARGWGEVGWGVGCREEMEAEAVSKFTCSLMLQHTQIVTSGRTFIIYHDYREQRAYTDSSFERF